MGLVLLYERNSRWHICRGLGICDFMVFLAALLILLSGCNTQAPTLMSQLETRAMQSDSAVANRLSDLAILKYSDAVKSKWGLRSMNSEILATGGKISVAALTTGILMAGPASGATSGLAGAASLILQVLGIIDPTARANAMGEGTSAILNAEGEYLISLAAAGVTEIPTDQFSAPAATLLLQINAAQGMVEKLAQGYRVSTSDSQKLEPLPMAELRDKIAAAPAFRSRVMPPCAASCQ